MDQKRVSRRTFLFGAATVTAGAAIGSVVAKLGNTAATVSEKVTAKLPTTFRKAPPLPADPATNIPGLSPLVTPTKDFFRIDNALVPPNLDANEWKLVIDGMVGSRREITYAELMAMPMVEVDCTISCVSNPVGGSYVGNARWLGVKLDSIIKSVGPQPQADQIMSYSSDGFSAGFSTAAAFDREAIIAVAMNGEVLTQEHGYPARLVVPGLYGYVSATKWLTGIELTRFDVKKGFWITRGWSQLGPIKTQSRIDSPRQGQSIDMQPRTISGVAWAPLHLITRVDVQIDDGPWQPAMLGPEISASTWRQWWIDWTPTPGKCRITVRATDDSGYTQTEELTPVEPDGATGWHTIVVNVA